MDVDNEDTFLRLIAPYNVIALFVGHGHADIQWKINGINCFMAKGLYQGSYNIIDGDATGFKIRRVTTKNRGDEPDLLATIPRVSPPYSHAEFLWGDPNVPLLERRRPLVQLEIGKLGAHDGGAPRFKRRDAPRLQSKCPQRGQSPMGNAGWCRFAGARAHGRFQLAAIGDPRSTRARVPQPPPRDGFMLV